MPASAHRRRLCHPDEEVEDQLEESEAEAQGRGHEVVEGEDGGDGALQEEDTHGREVQGLEFIRCSSLR